MGEWAAMHGEFSDDIVKNAAAGVTEDDAMIAFGTNALSILRKHVQNDAVFFNILENAKDEALKKKLDVIQEEENQIGENSEIQMILQRFEKDFQQMKNSYKSTNLFGMDKLYETVWPD